jgi:hypothetical protein
LKPNTGEKEAVEERQENPNEEVAIQSLRTCRREPKRADGLPRNDGGTSGMREANFSGHRI